MGPVVPVDHADARRLVALYGPSRGSTTPARRHRDASSRATATRLRGPRSGTGRAGPGLKRYAAVATRTRHAFTASTDAPAKAFTAEAADHPVFELRSPSTHGA
jgi:hypothetical protein